MKLKKYLAEHHANNSVMSMHGDDDDYDDNDNDDGDDDPDDDDNDLSMHHDYELCQVNLAIVVDIHLGHDGVHLQSPDFSA